MCVRTYACGTWQPRPLLNVAVAQLDALDVVFSNSMYISTIGGAALIYYILIIIATGRARRGRPIARSAADVTSMSLTPSTLME